MYINIFYLISYMEIYNSSYFDPNTYKCYSEFELSLEKKIVYLESESGNFVAHKWKRKSFDEKNIEKNIDISSLISLPKIHMKCIADRFVHNYENKKIREKLLKEYDKNKDSFFLIEKYNLNDEWEEYRIRHEISFASEWCEENNVNYSLKPLPETKRWGKKYWE